MSANNRIFEALASKPRREILAYLSASELTAGEISNRFNMSSPAISRHLSVLEAANLVSSERRGQFIYYTLNKDSLISTLMDFTFEICPTASSLKQESKAFAKKSQTENKLQKKKLKY